MSAQHNGAHRERELAAMLASSNLVSSALLTRDALVAIVGGFLVSRLVTLSAERSALSTGDIIGKSYESSSRRWTTRFMSAGLPLLWNGS